MKPWNGNSWGVGVQNKKTFCGGGEYGYFLELHIQAKLVEREIHEKVQQTNKFHDLQELCRPVNPQKFQKYTWGNPQRCSMDRVQWVVHGAWFLFCIHP